jgi:hypothetical protein
MGNHGWNVLSGVAEWLELHGPRLGLPGRPCRVEGGKFIWPWPAAGSGTVAAARARTAALQRARDITVCLVTRSPALGTKYPNMIFSFFFRNRRVF